MLMFGGVLVYFLPSLVWVWEGLDSVGFTFFFLSPGGTGFYDTHVCSHALNDNDFVPQSGSLLDLKDTESFLLHPYFS